MTTRRSNRVEAFSICLLYNRVDQGDICPKRGKAIFHNDHNQSSTPLSWFHYLKVLPYPQSESSLRYQDFNVMTLVGQRDNSHSTHAEIASTSISFVYELCTSSTCGVLSPVVQILEAHSKGPHFSCRFLVYNEVLTWHFTSLLKENYIFF